MDDTTTSNPIVDATARPTSRLPWPSLLVLGAATFVMVTAEMVPTAVLPEMSAGTRRERGADGPARLGLGGRRGHRQLPARATHPAPRPARRHRLEPRRARGLGGGDGAGTRLPDRRRRSTRRGALGRTALGDDQCLLRRPRRRPRSRQGRRRRARRRDARHRHRHADREPRRAGRWVARGILGPRGRRPGRGRAGAHGGRASAASGCRWAGCRGPDAAPRVEGSTDAASGADAAGGASATRGGTPRGILPMVAVVGLIALLLVGHYGTYTYITRLVEAPASQVPGRRRRPAPGVRPRVGGGRGARRPVRRAHRSGPRGERRRHRRRRRRSRRGGGASGASASGCSCCGAWPRVRFRRSRRR